MGDIQFVIHDYYDMLNLHKALLEAKFHESPDNVYVSGSPIVAKLYNELLDRLAECEAKKKGKENWTEWRKIKNQNFYKERAIDNIIHFSQWRTSDCQQKVDLIYNYFSPFNYTEDELSNLIYEIDNKF
ncbi:hypothetical protein ABFV83_10955 [Lacrimispora sp. BS-2]|uniref:Uncharacterized protein n=1 Tax=Lacrimispora sp. BS-2 TaxID=3151850 RepID=A0AAU7PJ50_9FIRM